MKFICIGRNYAEHAAELGNPLPETPVLFLKPDSALLPPGHPFTLPDWSQEVHYELEVIYRVGKEGKYIAPEFAWRHLDAIGLGLDLTARDLQQQLKAQGLPWDRAKGFNGSAVLSPLRPLQDYPSPADLHFELRVNGELRQKGWTGHMLYPVERMVQEASRYFTFKTGDILFTGTPAGVGPLRPGDRLEGYLQGQLLLTCRVQ